MRVAFTGNYILNLSVKKYSNNEIDIINTFPGKLDGQTEKRLLHFKWPFHNIVSKTEIFDVCNLSVQTFLSSRLEK